MNFTIEAYKKLIIALGDRGYCFYRHEDCFSGAELKEPHVMLRHDVDRMPGRALKLAALESSLGVASTFFFRVKPGSFDVDIIRQIQLMGHEIGYHYEELSDSGGDYELAWSNFKDNLRRFDEFGGIKSIAMHGRPLSKWDNRLLWERYDYKDHGVQCEAYRDLEWGKYVYFTDVGRSWNNSTNIRDIADGSISIPSRFRVKTTEDLLGFIHENNHNLIISSHPERWSDNVFAWLQVLGQDLAVNILKRMIRVFR